MRGATQGVLRERDTEPRGKGGKPRGSLAGRVEVDTPTLADPHDEVLAGNQVHREGPSPGGHEGGVHLRGNSQGSHAGHSSSDFVEPGTRNVWRRPRRTTGGQRRHKTMRPNSGLETDSRGTH